MKLQWFEGEKEIQAKYMKTIDMSGFYLTPCTTRISNSGFLKTKIKIKNNNPGNIISA
jgi:hypothetical protein